MNTSRYKFIRGYIREPRLLGGIGMAYESSVIIRISGDQSVPLSIISTKKYQRRYNIYWAVTKFVGKLPYPVRWVYWSLLYYYNRRKNPTGTFTLELYKGYAKRNI